MKYTAIALVTFGMLFNGALADEANRKEAKAKLAQAREKYE